MDILRQINWLDILVIIVIIRTSYVSFQRGFSHELFSFFGVLANLIISLRLYRFLGKMISGALPFIPVVMADFISFLGMSVAIGFLIVIIRSIVGLIVKVEWHSTLDRIGGMATGTVKSCLIASILLVILALTPLPYFQWSIRERSLTGMHVLKIAPAVYFRAQRFFPRLKIEGAPDTTGEFVEELVRDKTLKR